MFIFGKIRFMGLSKVIVVEDSIDDYYMINRHLGGLGIPILAIRVDTPIALSQALETGLYSAVLSDHLLPSMDAMIALNIVRKLDKDIPFIIVSGLIPEGLAISLMKGGANDFVMKDNLDRLGPALTRELAEANNRKESKQTESTLSEFIYRASTNLASPLSEIKGIISIMKQAKNIKEAEDCIPYLNNSTKLLSDSLNELMVLYKIRETQPAFKHIDLLKLLKETKEGVELDIVTSLAALEFEVKPMATFYTDLSLLGFIFEGLVRYLVPYCSCASSQKPIKIKVVKDRGWLLIVAHNITDANSNKVVEICNGGYTIETSLYAVDSAAQKLGGRV